MRFVTGILLAGVVAVAGCHLPCRNALPPAQRILEPGPGVGGPGPGIMMHQPAMPLPNQTSQIYFVGPEGMQVNWDVSAPGAFDSEPLICPGRQNFPQAAIYRLRISNIPGRNGVELYPTLEVGPAMPRTEAFLAHNAIPVQFTPEDFDQVLSGNFVTKVIYLPDPEFQELALAGVETLVSTRLDPGVDPIIEADRRGAILAIVRLGNKDLQGPAELLPADNQIIQQTSYNQALNGPRRGPCPAGVQVGGPQGVPPGYIAGVTMPQYGMPMSGTPIGLPGPPHVPLGSPAGLKKHVIVNHTHKHIPPPTDKVRLDVKQKPGMSYPKPPSRAIIVEKSHKGLGWFGQPLLDKIEFLRTPRRTAAHDPCENCPE